MTLVFGKPGIDAAAFQLHVISRRPFPEVLNALRQAIDEAGMKVLHEIDPQGALRSVDQVIGGARLLFFFHPHLLAQLLEIDASALVEVPLKLVVLEMPGGAVSIRIADPTTAMERYGNSDLASFGRELSAACDRIIRATT
ncbi:MAG: DUF302 domain-containing protein [Janthinobacterium lividum]